MGSIGNTYSVSIGDILRSSAARRVKLLKLCDWTFGPLALLFLCRKKSGNVLLSLSEPQRILVIRPGGIGDAVLLVPFLKKLKGCFFNSKIDILAEKRNIQVFDSLEGIINESFCYEEGMLALMRRFKSASYGIVFDTEQWHSFSAAFACTTGASVRIGFDTNKKRSGCYNVLVPYRHGDFEGVSFFNMLSRVVASPINWDWDKPFFDVPKAALEWANERLSGRTAIALSLKGGIKERCYPVKKWQSLCEKLIKDGFDICLIGSRQDTDCAKAFSDALPSGKIIDLTGQASLMQSAAAIGLCRAFIGTDSGSMHLAFGVGTPIVALFGSGIEAKWAPVGKRTRIINKGLACSPCTRFGYTPGCPIKVRCLEDITVEEILSAMQEFI